MARRREVGVCHLCGEVRKLTFEHVPPQAANNGCRVVAPDIHRVLSADDLDEVPSMSGKQSQRGQGGYTLCEACNSTTGGWYGPGYIEWINQANAFLENSSLDVACRYELKPLSVLKQIASMFFSINSPEFRKSNPGLEEFVRDKNKRTLPKNCRVYSSYLRSVLCRSAGVTAKIDVKSSEIVVFSEISFPPFSYLMTFDSASPDPRFLDISGFADYGYDEFSVFDLKFPVLGIYTPIPGGFRTREQVIDEMNQGLER